MVVQIFAWKFRGLYEDIFLMDAFYLGLSNLIDVDLQENVWIKKSANFS